MSAQYLTATVAIEDHMPLVRRIAADYAGVLGYEEAVGVGSAGLMHAASTWNPDRCPWGSWAAKIIRQRLSRAADWRLRTDVVTSLDAPAYEGEDGETPDLHEIIDSHVPDAAQALSHRQAHRSVMALLATLSEDDYRLIELRYGLSGPPLTLQQIGNKWNRSREAIRVRLHKILRKMCENLESAL